MESIEYVCLCPCLKSISLDGTPISASFENNAQFRRKVISILPNLKILDDIDVTEEDKLSKEEFRESFSKLKYVKPVTPCVQWAQGLLNFNNWKN
ncbi:hypothetical protein HK096_008873 [Nowakowskiella sp. JEL0078]|nr:hypothetical protein HK096_008873 [Nowakowskiella sp. JEL0078]